jgi:hypothetical protein
LPGQASVGPEHEEYAAADAKSLAQFANTPVLRRLWLETYFHRDWSMTETCLRTEKVSNKRLRVSVVGFESLHALQNQRT